MFKIYVLYLPIAFWDVLLNVTDQKTTSPWTIKLSQINYPFNNFSSYFNGLLQSKFALKIRTKSYFFFYSVRGFCKHGCLKGFCRCWARIKAPLWPLESSFTMLSVLGIFQKYVCQCENFTYRRKFFHMWFSNASFYQTLMS